MCKKEHFLYVNRLVLSTQVEGPGTRAAVWVQGCSLKCPGCFNQEMWSKEYGDRINVKELAGKILATEGIEGVTFLGGEPFDQAEPLVYLADFLRQEGLSILTFTGYQLEDLQNSSDINQKKLLELTDLLIDGPFIKKKTDYSRPWVGSSNQRYHFLSDRYVDLRQNLFSIDNAFEIRIDEKGRVQINGMGNLEKLVEELYHL